MACVAPLCAQQSTRGRSLKVAASQSRSKPAYNWLESSLPVACYAGPPLGQVVDDDPGMICRALGAAVTGAVDLGGESGAVAAGAGRVGVRNDAATGTCRTVYGHGREERDFPDEARWAGVNNMKCGDGREK